VPASRRVVVAAPSRPRIQWNLHPLVSIMSVPALIPVGGW
jgi:hypothetical protein